MFFEHLAYAFGKKKRGLVSMRNVMFGKPCFAYNIHTYYIEEKYFFLCLKKRIEKGLRKGDGPGKLLSGGLGKLSGGLGLLSGELGLLSGELGLLSGKLELLS